MGSAISDRQAERVQAHQATGEVQSVQQLGDDGQLAPFGLGRSLGEHEPVLGGVGADQVQGRAAVPAVERAPHGLTVDGYLPQRTLVGSEDRPDPAEEAALERLGVDQREDTAEGVVRGDAVRQLKEALEPVALAAAVQRDVLEALRLADHGTDRDHEDVEQSVLNLPLATRVLDRPELGD
jgi:hypothetical protein